MNSDFPTNPREALEASLTAMLLGELPPDQVAFLERLLAEDAELRATYEQVKETIGFVREAETEPKSQQPAPEEPLKLSAERREQLLAHFKTVPLEQPPLEKRRSFSPVLVVAAVLVGMLFLGSMFLSALAPAKSKGFRTWSLADRGSSGAAVAPASPANQLEEKLMRERRGETANSTVADIEPGVPLAQSERAPIVLPAEPDGLDTITVNGSSANMPARKVREPELLTMAPSEPSANVPDQTPPVLQKNDYNNFSFYRDLNASGGALTAGKPAQQEAQTAGGRADNSKSVMLRSRLAGLDNKPQNGESVELSDRETQNWAYISPPQPSAAEGLQAPAATPASPRGFFPGTSPAQQTAPAELPTTHAAQVPIFGDTPLVGRLFRDEPKTPELAAKIEKAPKDANVAGGTAKIGAFGFGEGGEKKMGRSDTLSKQSLRVAQGDQTVTFGLMPQPLASNDKAENGRRLPESGQTALAGGQRSASASLSGFYDDNSPAKSNSIRLPATAPAQPPKQAGALSDFDHDGYLAQAPQNVDQSHIEPSSQRMLQENLRKNTEGLGAQPESAPPPAAGASAPSSSLAQNENEAKARFRARYGLDAGSALNLNRGAAKFANPGKVEAAQAQEGRTRTSGNSVTGLPTMETAVNEAVLRQSDLIQERQKLADLAARSEQAQKPAATREGTGGEKELGRVPILGDMPLIGHFPAEQPPKTPTEFVPQQSLEAKETSAEKPKIALTGITQLEKKRSLLREGDRPAEQLADADNGKSEKPAAEPKYNRIIKVDPKTFEQGLQAATGFDWSTIPQDDGLATVPRVTVAGGTPPSGGLGGGTGGIRDITRTNNTASLQTMARQFFLNMGVDLTPSDALFFNEREGTLLVRASPKDLEIIQAAVGALNQGASDNPTNLENKLQTTVSSEPDVAAPKSATPPPTPQPEVDTRENTFSTFSLNVSDVSFKLAAASLEKGSLPDAAGIRSEEFINAFDYRDPEPPAGTPVGFAYDRARYPFTQNRDLLRFSIKTAAQGRQAGRPLNLVILLDNSGSMERADRVQIIKEALHVLARQLQAQDKISLVTFARTAQLRFDGLPGNQATNVADEASGLTPQGGTNLEEAMNLAYATARKHYLADGINRVVLLTDGAANLGDVEPENLKKKVEEHRKQGIALDCFGIGWEGLNDDLLEVLSRNGDGRYGFINTPEEAATGFAAQLAGALHVAASDVKVQVEFNPKRVSAWRQIGYAKHQLTKEQFRDNTVDAAELGAAESGNALYVVNVIPSGEGPLATVRVRYKVPGTTDYHEHEWSVAYNGSAATLEQAAPAIRLAAVASAFSEWLAASPYATEVTTDQLLNYLRGIPETYGPDPRPQKLEWMLRQAKSLSGK